MEYLQQYLFVHFVQRVSLKELMQDKTQAIFNQIHSFECCQGDKSEMIWLQHIPPVLSIYNIHSCTVVSLGLLHKHS